MRRRSLIRRGAFLLPALGVFVLFLLIRLPASFVTLFLPPEIQMREVEGSFWNGRASAVGVGGLLVQEQVSWNFRPRALSGLQLAWAVSGRMAGETSRLELALGPRGVEWNGVGLALPLEPLAALHPQLKSAQLGALLRVSAKNLSLSSPFELTITAERVFSALVPQGEFGSYRLDGKGMSEGKGDWQITTLSGVLRIAGKGTFDAVRSNASGQVTLTPRSPIPGLSPMLTSLPKAANGYVLSF
jgi:hypothetical protein